MTMFKVKVKEIFWDLIAWYTVARLTDRFVVVVYSDGTFTYCKKRVCEKYGLFWCSFVDNLKETNELVRPIGHVKLNRAIMCAFRKLKRKVKNDGGIVKITKTYCNGVPMMYLDRQNSK